MPGDSSRPTHRSLNWIWNPDTLAWAPETQPGGNGPGSAADYINGTTAAIIDTTRTQIIAAQATGVRIYVSALIVTNSHASVGTFVQIEDGTSVIWEGYAASAGGGFVTPFIIPLRGSTATALNAQCVTSGANVIVSAAGYIGP